MTSVTSLGVTNYISQLWTRHDFSIFVNNWPSGWGIFFSHNFVGQYYSVIKGCMIPSQVRWAEEKHVLGLVTGASGVLQALDLDHPPPTHPPPPSPTLLVEHLQIYSHIFQLTSLVIPVTVHHHHCLHQGFLLHFKNVFSFYFFILRSLHSGIWKGQRLFQVLGFFSAFAELSKKFAIYQFKNILGIGSVL